MNYIDILIESEKSETNPGWMERVKHLEEQRKLAAMIADAQDPNYDPFEKYKDEESYVTYAKEKIRNFLTWKNYFNDFPPSAQNLSSTIRKG